MKKPTKKKKLTPKKKKKKANPVGRPPFYKTAEAMQKKIEAYFKDPPFKREIRNKEGELIATVPVLTITGLVLYLGFCDRASFYDLEKDPKFSHTIKKARSFIEQEYEVLLQKGLGAGAIFALKNFGWVDKKEIDIGGKGGGPIKYQDTSKMNIEELAALIAQEREG